MAPQMDKSFSYPFAYINQIDKLVTIQNNIQTIEDCLDINKIERAMAVRAALLVKTTALDF